MQTRTILFDDNGFFFVDGRIFNCIRSRILDDAKQSFKVEAQTCEMNFQSIFKCQFSNKLVEAQVCLSYLVPEKLSLFFNDVKLIIEFKWIYVELINLITIYT